jgi:hypothetical protein
MKFWNFYLNNFRKLSFHGIILLNFLLAWPIFSLTISALLKKENVYLDKIKKETIGSFLFSGYHNNLPLSLSLSIGSAIIFPLLFSWLRHKNDRVLERHFIRAILGGGILSLLNLFPAFFLYQLILGESDFQKNLIASIIGPIISLGITGPPAAIAGAVMGFFNGLMAELERKKLMKN